LVAELYAGVHGGEEKVVLSRALNARHYPMLNDVHVPYRKANL
jgi:hypothetical protein